MIRLRVYKAVDEPETCEKFAEGHMKILRAFGISMITSANLEWTHDPYTYVLIAEDPDSGKVLGGARVQMAGGKYPLPIINAVEELDMRIHDVVKQYAIEGAGELCGLWNSREIAGMGIGSVFLTRTAVCIAPQLKLKSLFALCAPYTVEMAQRMGFQIATFLGNQGTFYYPKEDLLATGMILHDSGNLASAAPEERKEILSLREMPRQLKIESGRRGEFELLYDLEIPNKS